MEKIWAVEKGFIVRYLEKIENATSEQLKIADSLFSTEELPNILSFDGDTAIIKINGILSKDGPDWIDLYFGFGGTSYDKIIESVDIIKNKAEIKTVKLEIDSPGGDIKGVDEVWQSIQSLAKEKKVIAENKGMMASAGYWIASAANEIIAESPVAQTGSIGVVITAVDYSKMEKDAGIKRIKILSKNAPNKRPDAATKKGEAILQDKIDAMERVFIKRVATGRSISADKVINDFGKGALLIADDPDKEKDDALSVGMIDRVETVEVKSKNNNAGAKAGDSLSSHDGINKPAVAETKKTEGKMDLKQFLVENPSAESEIEKLKIESYDKGFKEGKENLAKRNEKALAFVGGDGYPKAIQNLAADVLKGEKDIASLEAAVAVIDSNKEEAASAAAKTETKDQKETPAEQAAAKSEDGKIKTEEDLDATIAEDRKRLGIDKEGDK